MIKVSPRLQADDGLRSASRAYTRGGRGLESDNDAVHAFIDSRRRMGRPLNSLAGRRLRTHKQNPRPDGPLAARFGAARQKLAEEGHAETQIRAVHAGLHRQPGHQLGVIPL